MQAREEKSFSLKKYFTKRKVKLLNQNCSKTVPSPVIPGECNHDQQFKKSAERVRRSTRFRKHRRDPSNQFELQPATRKIIKIIADTETDDETSSNLFFMYPFTGSKRLRVTKYDVDRLAEGIFLNDILLNFYFKFIENEKVRSRKYREQTLFLSTFFFQELVKPLVPNTSPKDNVRIPKNFSSMKNWAEKADFLSKKLIVIPINHHLHWSVGIVLNADLLAKDNIEKEEILNSNAERSLTFLYCDSLSVNNAKRIASCVRVLLELLVGEQLHLTNDQENHDKQMVLIQQLRLISPKLPQQTNHYDCGIYVLHYVEVIVELFFDMFEPDGSCSIELFKDLRPYFVENDFILKRSLITDLCEKFRVLYLQNHNEQYQIENGILPNEEEIEIVSHKDGA